MTESEKFRALAHSLHSRATAVESVTLRKEMLALATRFETLAAADELAQTKAGRPGSADGHFLSFPRMPHC